MVATMTRTFRMHGATGDWLVRVLQATDVMKSILAFTAVDVEAQLSLQAKVHAVRVRLGTARLRMAQIVVNATRGTSATLASAVGAQLAEAQVQTSRHVWPVERGSSHQQVKCVNVVQKAWSPYFQIQSVVSSVQQASTRTTTRSGVSYVTRVGTLLRWRRNASSVVTVWSRNLCRELVNAVYHALQVALERVVRAPNVSRIKLQMPSLVEPCVRIAPQSGVASQASTGVASRVLLESNLLHFMHQLHVLAVGSACSVRLGKSASHVHPAASLL